jgi:hypothetical protein
MLRLAQHNLSAIGRIFDNLNEVPSPSRAVDTQSSHIELCRCFEGTARPSIRLRHQQFVDFLSCT